MAFKDSKTYQNLLIAYQKELILCSKYLIYSDIARNQNYIEMSNVYDVTSQNNKEHARIWLRIINEGNLPTLSEALLQSAQEEYEISNVMYQNFGDIAREEGYNDIAALFSGVANIDYTHSAHFNQMYNDLEVNQVFCKPEKRLWICMQCGNIMSGECAPEICPVCEFPQGYYKLYID